MAQIIEVRKTELHDARVTTFEAAPLEDQQVRLAVDAFGITANNITYAVFGDMMAYWNFFPAPSGDEFGVIPVWGYADVVESKAEGIEEGERIYGYFPMGSELIATAGRVKPASFADVSDHRLKLPSAYNNYVRCSGDPMYDAALEDSTMLLQPLFFTSFLIDDFLADKDFFGATQVVATSASSKTGFGTAHMLAKREGLKVIGLTSASNVEFVQSLGCYDEVVTYDQIDQLPAGPTSLVDFAGNQNVVKAVHEHYGDDLKHSAIIGGTHWDADRPEPAPMPGPQPEFFFAPTRIEIRAKDWGVTEMQTRLGTAFGQFVPFAEQFLGVEHLDGLEAGVDVYLNVLGGNASASRAQVVKP